MSGENFISIVAVIVTAVATSIGTISAVSFNKYSKKKDDDNKVLQIRKLLNEIREFSSWYVDARDSLHKLHDVRNISITTAEMLSEYRSNTRMFKGTFSHWTDKKAEIISILEKKYNTDVANECREFMDEAVSFIKLLEHLLEIMSTKDYRSITYIEFCSEFYNSFCPDMYKRIFGDNFKVCLRQKMLKIENGYKQIAEKFELEPVEIGEPLG
ncbi:hypothetical protein [Ruminococcus sp. YE282]|uniref:hypothetical protein n=1 Tax=Ruminococcus sp. YE282 TaxID=3158780 RepID=UPI000888043F|nr:hypothetical protein SAMN02910441_02328 [Ruminococcus bromii]